MLHKSILHVGEARLGWLVFTEARDAERVLRVENGGWDGSGLSAFPISGRWSKGARNFCARPPAGPQRAYSGACRWRWTQEKAGGNAHLVDFDPGVLGELSSPSPVYRPLVANSWRFGAGKANDHAKPASSGHDFAAWESLGEGTTLGEGPGSL